MDIAISHGSDQQVFLHVSVFTTKNMSNLRMKHAAVQKLAMGGVAGHPARKKYLGRSHPEW